MRTFPKNYAGKSPTSTAIGQNPTLPRSRRMVVNARNLAATAAFVLITLGAPNPLDASGPSQSGSEAPDIAEPECSFWLDHDNDGEGDEPFEADAYVLQETPVVGGCSFKLQAPDEATILMASELKDWEVEVELKREPGPTDDFKMYSGRTEIPGVKGNMRVILNFAEGDTPLHRRLPQGDHHPRHPGPEAEGGGRQAEGPVPIGTLNSGLYSRPSSPAALPFSDVSCRAPGKCSAAARAAAPDRNSEPMPPEGTDFNADRAKRYKTAGAVPQPMPHPRHQGLSIVLRKPLIACTPRRRGGEPVEPRAGPSTSSG